MNHPINTFTGAPTESSIAVCAPHLITPFSLMDGNPACWTIFRVFLKHLCGRNITRIADMIWESGGWLNTLWNHSLDFMTCGANLNIAHLASPMSAQETIAVIGRTRFDKLARGSSRFLTGIISISKLPHTPFRAINFILNNTHISLH